MQVDVLALSADKVIFEGKASSVRLPGEEGAFEIQPFHKRLISRLVSGVFYIDDKEFPLKRGIAKVENNTVLIIAE